MDRTPPVLPKPSATFGGYGVIDRRLATRDKQIKKGPAQRAEPEGVTKTQGMNVPGSVSRAMRATTYVQTCSRNVLENPGSCGFKDGLLQVGPEKRSQFVERNEAHPIIEVHMSCAWYDDQFLGLTSQFEGFLAEFQ